MTPAELAHLELLAELDSLCEALQQWADQCPAWEPARACRALVLRLLERMRLVRLRLESPLVVATVGGTGVGKSALVNALAGDEVVKADRSRPTTRLPTLVCRPSITPDLLGIDPDGVNVVHRDLPALANLVLVDCPDPDTTETPDSPGTNLARLRRILPHCDVLLVTTTQQKYRSARVADELAAAASGARLVFVQTHADTDQDIRDDWRRVLEPQYVPGHIYLIDCLAALADARSGLEPRGEFAGLVDLLTRQLTGTAAARIRRANLLDLVEQTLRWCAERLEGALPAVTALEEAIQSQRSRLASWLAGPMREELAASRRHWENRLLAQIASRWGLSPFAMLLRIHQGLGGLLFGALLLRARTPAQMALWGAIEGVRSWRRRRRDRQAASRAAQTLSSWLDPSELRAAALVLDGYAAEAGLAREAVSSEAVAAEAAAAGQAFLTSVSVELDGLIARLARQHTRWFTRWRYEILLVGMAGVLLYRPARNFFYDSWLGPQQWRLLGLDFYLLTLFWLLVWCGLLLWGFSSRLRRGLRREIDRLAAGWSGPQPAAGMFAALEVECRRAARFYEQLQRLRHYVAGLCSRLALADETLGHKR
ncbi:MAG: GTPase [Thermoguttaceae bacterium]